MKTSLFALIAALAFVTVANAAPMQNLSFEQLRSACREPKKFQNQILPTTIVLDCSERMLRWTPSNEGSFTLPSKRVITHAVKYGQNLIDEGAGRPRDILSPVDRRWRRLPQ